MDVNCSSMQLPCLDDTNFEFWVQSVCLIASAMKITKYITTKTKIASIANKEECVVTQSSRERERKSVEGKLGMLYSKELGIKSSQSRKCHRLLSSPEDSLNSGLLPRGVAVTLAKF